MWIITNLIPKAVAHVTNDKTEEFNEDEDKTNLDYDNPFQDSYLHMEFIKTALDVSDDDDSYNEESYMTPIISCHYII
jgi:hypothetical protein